MMRKTHEFQQFKDLLSQFVGRVEFIIILFYVMRGLSSETFLLYFPGKTLEGGMHIVMDLWLHAAYTTFGGCMN